MIAALYIDANGPYPHIPGIDCWDIDRDATQYNGEGPLILHPPCGHWGRYSHKAHDDGHTGPLAVAQVRKWGGVLEHPKDSKLWAKCGIPKPGEFPDQWGGYSILVFQRDWGHRADKATWLYIVGCPPDTLPDQPLPQPPRSGWTPKKRMLRTQKDLSRHWSGTRGILECMSKKQRRLTPLAFAEWLVEVVKQIPSKRKPRYMK